MSDCCTSSDSLWKKINDRAWVCDHDSSKCSRIDTKEGYALSPEDPKVNPDLLVATKCISGIECSTIIENDTPNYWNLAWAKLALPPPLSIGSKAGMAINAKCTGSGKPTRTHDQLHIHVSCIDPAVTKALDNNKNIKLLPNWSIQPITSSIGTYKYRVTFLEHDGDLARYNLFKLVYNEIGKHQDAMQYQTLIVAKRHNGGFYILNSDTITQALNPGISDGERLLVGC